MDKVFLKRTVIFRGMTDDELDTALRALEAREKDYRKDEYILHAADTTDYMVSMNSTSRSTASSLRIT